MLAISLVATFSFVLLGKFFQISSATDFYDANAEFHDADGTMNAIKPSIRYHKIRAQFEYKSSVQLFGVNYYFNMGFNGYINGRMTMQITKESETNNKKEQIIKDFGAEIEDFEGTEVRSKEEANFVLELNGPKISLNPCHFFQIFWKTKCIKLWPN